MDSLQIFIMDNKESSDSNDYNSESKLFDSELDSSNSEFKNGYRCSKYLSDLLKNVDFKPNKLSGNITDEHLAINTFNDYIFHKTYYCPVNNLFIYTTPDTKETIIKNSDTYITEVLVTMSKDVYIQSSSYGNRENIVNDILIIRQYRNLLTKLLEELPNLFGIKKHTGDIN